MNSIDLVDLRLTRPPDGMKPSKKSLGAGAADSTLGMGTGLHSAPLNAIDFRGMEEDIGDDDAKRYHSMLINFLEDGNGQLRLDVDLKAFEIDSKRRVSNITVQELCKIHPDLRVIRLTDCRISDVALWIISKYAPHISGIYLSGCQNVTNVGLRSFSLRCSELTTIDLSRCPQLDDVGLSSIASGCWKLVHITLKHCTGITDEGLRTITVCRDMESLDLEGCINVGDFGSRILKDLGFYCPKLRLINFLGCKRLEDPGLHAIAKGCPYIETFCGSGCQFVTGKGLKSLLKRGLKLKTLTLRDCAILSDKDLQVALRARTEVFMKQRQGIHGLLLRDSLETLDISGAKLISDHGVTVLGESSIGSSLLSLNIAQSCVTDHASKRIAEKMLKLRSLDLSFCAQLTDSTVHNIATGVTALSTLKLNGNTSITMGSLMSHLGEKLPFANLATSWVGYEPKLDHEAFILAAERRQLHTQKAIVIQSAMRRRLARVHCAEKRRLWLVEKSIPRVQALVRGAQQRKRYFARQLELLRHRTAAKIQSQFRKFVEKCKLDRVVKARKWLEYKEEKSRLLQRLFRGMVGRKKARARRDLLGNKELQRARVQAKREIKAGVIQRFVRAKTGRNKASVLRDEKERLQRLAMSRDRACRTLQRIVRGSKGRVVASMIRREAEHQRLKWSQCVEIQRVYRGHVARVVTADLRVRRLNELKWQCAIEIQRVFRGHRGCLRAERVRAERNHLRSKQRASKNIQRLVRGHIARVTTAWLLDESRKNRQEERAALLFQRVFRGHKGREAVEVERELVKLEVLAKPLFMLLEQYAKQSVELTSQIENLIKDIDKLKEEIDESELEWQTVCQSENEYADSSRLNKTPQRFVTKFLRVRLKDYITQTTDVYNKKREVLVKLQTRSNEVARLTRKTKRELIPLTTGLITKVKAGRGKRLRAKIRKRDKSVKAIQSTYRGYVVRRGYRDPARDYWILCTDEEQSEQVYYYNTWTHATSWKPPFLFKYLNRRLPSFEAEEDEYVMQEDVGTGTIFIH